MIQIVIQGQLSYSNKKIYINGPNTANRFEKQKSHGHLQISTNFCKKWVSQKLCLKIWHLCSIVLN